MITVIGGTKATVRMKLMPPERDIEKQRKQDEEALLQEYGKTLGEHPGKPESEEDARFRRYYEAKMREQQSASYWDDINFGMRDFGGYPPVDDQDTEILVDISGCSYTVAKLLARRAEAGKVAFVSVVGDDAIGLAAIQDLQEAGVDVSGVRKVEGATPVSIEIRNIIGDLEFARGNNALAGMITPQLLEENRQLLEQAECIFVDGSLPVETLRYVSDEFADACPIYFDPASIQGGVRFADAGMKATCVMPGRMEAEAMSNQQVLGIQQLMEAGEAFEERGVKQTVITLIGGGVYHKEGSVASIINPQRVLSFADTTGSGDVLSAELVYQLWQGASLAEAAQAAMDAVGETLKDVEDIMKY